MTVTSALVPPTRRGALRTAPLRLAIFDSSVLTTDVIAATRRAARHSSFVDAMENGALRGFITRTIWAEVPRVLEDRWREGDGAFDLDAALRIWWRDYVPMLYTVDTDRLPSTPKSERLAEEDPSDVGTLLLHAALRPAAVIACDRDLRRSGIAHEDWVALRSAVGQVAAAEGQAVAATRVTGLAAEVTALVVVRMTRTALGHPVMALVVATTVAGGLLARRRSHRSSASKIKLFLRGLGEVIVEKAGEINERFTRGEAVWDDAERGSVGDTLLYRVARVLACSPQPMTRSDILNAVPEFPGRTHFDRMYGLYALLRSYPMFCETCPHRWQVGRVDVGAGLIEAVGRKRDSR